MLDQWGAIEMSNLNVLGAIWLEAEYQMSHYVDRQVWLIALLSREMTRLWAAIAERDKQLVATLSIVSGFNTTDKAAESPPDPRCSVHNRHSVFDCPYCAP